MRKNFQFFILLYSFVGFFLIFTGIFCYFLFIPNPYLTPFLLGWINEQGWGKFEIANISLQLHQIHLKNVKYTPTPELPPLIMESANIEIAWDQFSPKVQGVVLKDLVISKEAIENMIKAPSSSPAFLIPPLTFENAIVRSQDPSFPFTLSFEGKFIPETSFNGRLHLTFLDGELESVLEATLSPSNIEATLSQLSLSLKSWEHFPLSGQGKLTFKNNKINVNFSGSGSDLKLKGQCTYKTQDQNGSCTLTYQSNALENIIPKLWLQTYSLQDFSGAFEGSANLTIKNGVKQPIKGNIAFSHLSFKHSLLTAQNLSTSLQYRFDKELSFPKQALKILIDKADLGLPLSNLYLELTWDGEAHYHLQKGRAFLEGGQITTENVFLSLSFKKISLPLKFKNIPAQFFVTLSHVPHLTVSGHVRGQLGIEFTDKDYGLQAGSTLSIQDPPGTIQYRPGIEPKTILSLTGDENPMDLIFLALWDFQYEKVSLDLEKPLQGQLQATLHLKGKNPHLLGSHPFEFNIKASGQLKELRVLV